MEELITIATFSSSARAYLLKAKLESEGITCVLKDVYMNNLFATVSFDIKVQVYFTDSFKALDIFYEMKNEWGTSEI